MKIKHICKKRQSKVTKIKNLKKERNRLENKLIKKPLSQADLIRTNNRLMHINREIRSLVQDIDFLNHKLDEVSPRT